MPVIKSHQPLPASPPIIVLFGDPGVSKTSIAQTCELPMTIDFDRGLRRAIGRKDALAPVNWEEVIEQEQAGLFKGYKTIVIDTAKAALDDFLMTYVKRLDHTNTTNTQRAYGALGDHFKTFLNNRREQQDAAIIIIAHAKKDEDLKRMIPDVTGGSYAVLMRMADQVGYVSMRNGERTISFEPTDNVVGKNVARLGLIQVPPSTHPDWPTFGQKLVNDVVEAITNMDEAQLEANRKSAAYQLEIEQVADDNLTELYDILPVIEELPDFLSAPLIKVVGDRFKDKFEKMDKPEDLTAMIAEVAGLPPYLAQPLKGMLHTHATKKVKLVWSDANKCYEASAFNTADQKDPASTNATPDPAADNGQKNAVTEGNPKTDIEKDIDRCKTSADIASVFALYEKEFNADADLMGKLGKRKSDIEGGAKTTKK